MQIERTNIVINPDRSRVYFRPFQPSSQEQRYNILRRINSLNTDEVSIELKKVCDSYKTRHINICDYFLKRFEELQHYLTDYPGLNTEKKMLIGAYFTHEYSAEAAALFNPSIILHPDQSDLPAGSMRFILSLRATGEGHISSIQFRTGIIYKDYKISLDPVTRFISTPKMFTDPNFGKNQYGLSFPKELLISQRIIVPSTPAEQNGIEDARFVRFQEPDGSYKYYATFTAYDGKTIIPELLETDDFLTFKISPFHGSEVSNKGMAIFPRKINGVYAMLSRQDNENNFIMFSDQLEYWNKKEFLFGPEYRWELIQMGNCGSPIETDEGWLVLTHGVGAMREYSIGAVLLDLEDPRKVIGRLKDPLINPNENEREGYVPNVVYSCGSIIHNEKLIIPYAMSDYASGFVKVGLRELLNKIKS